MHLDGIQAGRIRRRDFLVRTGLGLARAGKGPLWAAPASRGFQIGACDGSIGKLGGGERGDLRVSHEGKRGVAGKREGGFQKGLGMSGCDRVPGLGADRGLGAARGVDAIQRSGKSAFSEGNPVSMTGQPWTRESVFGPDQPSTRPGHPAWAGAERRGSRVPTNWRTLVRDVDLTPLAPTIAPRQPMEPGYPASSF